MKIEALLEHLVWVCSLARAVYTLDDGRCEFDVIPVPPFEEQVRTDRHDEVRIARLSWAPEERLVERVLIQPQ